MSVEHVERFYALFFAGLGLLLVGATNALWRGLGDRGRAALALLAGGAVVGGVWAWEPSPRVVSLAAAVVGAGTAACLLAGSSWLAAAAARAAAVVRRPAGRWGLLGAAGLVCLVGSVAQYQREDDRIIETGMRDLDIITRVPETAAVARAATDQGSEIALKRPVDPSPAGEVQSSERRVLDLSPYRDAVVRRAPAADGTNCHGWVFAAGRFWIGGTQVPTILKDNGYLEVSEPRPGDLAVYRGSDGTVSHSAVVRYVTPGMPVLVEGKWGWMGVFLHPVEQSAYGADYTYYRSPRPGHTLAGLDDRQPDQVPVE
jgi:hypothetical protein